ncbi:hypothetical protein NST99_08390 [Paenibacillus sp. FSL L8-0470]|uniref:hypothetical protein n=1 Tax=unclassified Paenibacillus TaxID=185978 RepID=UPI0030FB6A86
MLEHAGQIRQLAEEYKVGLSDSFAAFQTYIDGGGELEDLLSYVNHPNEQGAPAASRRTGEISAVGRGGCLHEIPEKVGRADPGEA